MQNLAPLEPASPNRLQRATASPRTVNKSLRPRPKQDESRYLFPDRPRFGRKRAFIPKTRKRSQLTGFRDPPRLCPPNSELQPADEASYQQIKMRDKSELGIGPRNQLVTYTTKITKAHTEAESAMQTAAQRSSRRSHTRPQAWIR